MHWIYFLTAVAGVLTTHMLKQIPCLTHIDSYKPQLKLQALVRSHSQVLTSVSQSKWFSLECFITPFGHIISTHTHKATVWLNIIANETACVQIHFINPLKMFSELDPQNHQEKSLHHLCRRLLQVFEGAHSSVVGLTVFTQRRMIMFLSSHLL